MQNVEFVNLKIILATIVEFATDNDIEDATQKLEEYLEKEGYDILC